MWAPPGRPARAGCGCPSPCGALRGLQLRGGVSLLEWERPAGQGETRNYPRPERGGTRVKCPPEPPQPRAGPPSGALPPAGRGSQPAGAPASGPSGRPQLRRRKAALQPPPRGAYWVAIWRLSGRERSCPGWKEEQRGKKRGSRAPTPRRQRVSGLPGRVCTNKTPWENFSRRKVRRANSLFPPRAPTFFSEGDSGSPVLSRGFLSHSSLPRTARL